MLLSSGFNVVCRFASQGSFPISCYNSSHRILFFKIRWHFKIRKNLWIKKKLKFVFSIYEQYNAMQLTQSNIVQRNATQHNTILNLYRVGQKSKPAYFCNNSVYWEPIFHSLAYIHYRKFATEGYIVSPPNTVYVTALPCKILIMTLPIFTRPWGRTHHLKISNICQVRFF